MGTLLHIEASPRKDRSHSIVAAKHFLETYVEQHPADVIETLDLWSVDLPPFDADTIGAKFAVLTGNSPTPAQAAAWQRVADFASQFAAADRYLVSTPMWNYTVPYVLKHYIDVVTLPGVTWRWYSAEGYTGLLP